MNKLTEILSELLAISDVIKNSQKAINSLCDYAETLACKELTAEEKKTLNTILYYKKYLFDGSDEG